MAAASPSASGKGRGDTMPTPANAGKGKGDDGGNGGASGWQSKESYRQKGRTSVLSWESSFPKASPRLREKPMRTPPLQMVGILLIMSLMVPRRVKDL